MAVSAADAEHRGCIGAAGAARVLGDAADADVVERRAVEAFDQLREQKPGGSWTDRQYVGPKQYDKLFVASKHDAPMSLDDPPSGPLGQIDHVDLVGGGKLLATIPNAELHYTAEHYSEFADETAFETSLPETTLAPPDAATSVPAGG